MTSRQTATNPAETTDWMAIPGYRSPAEDLLGVSVPEADTGRARVVQTGVPATCSLGWLGVLVDTAGGRWLAHRIEPGMWCPTVTMHLELVRPPAPAQDAVLVAEGGPLSHGDGWALGEFVVKGAGPVPLAVGTARFLVVEGEPVLPPRLEEAWGEPVPASDLETLLGVRHIEVTDGGASLTFRPAIAHANPYGIVHGGLHLALVDLAMGAAVNSGLGSGPVPPGTGMDLLSLDVAFHRPIPIGESVSVSATTLHRGRSAALAEATVRTGGGKPLTTARGSFGRFRATP